MNRWFSMKLTPENNECGEIMIYDEIGKNPYTGEGMGAVDFDAELKALGPVKNINLRLNSPGGDVFDGLAIYNMLKNHPATVTASVDGIAASAASLIAMAADKIVMPENSFMLIHKPMGFTKGTDDDHIATASNLERMGASVSNAYATRTGQTPEAAMALMREDRLMTATEAKSLGYADEMSSSVKMAASFDLKLLPEKARAVMSAAIEQEKPEIAEPEPAAEVVEPVVAAPVVAEPSMIEAGTVLGKVTAGGKYTTGENPVAAYGDAEVHKTLDLCATAKRPGMAAAFIKAKTPVAEVAEKLIAAQAVASDALELDTTPPKTPTAHMDEWKDLQARVKSEMRIGAKVGK